MDVILGDGISISIARALDKVINCPCGLQDSEFSPNRVSSSQENEIRNIDNRSGPKRQHGLEVLEFCQAK